MNIEAMKKWLEAFDDRSSLMKWQEAREDLRQAIADLEKQESDNTTYQKWYQLGAFFYTPLGAHLLGFGLFTAHMIFWG